MLLLRLLLPLLLPPPPPPPFVLAPRAREWQQPVNRHLSAPPHLVARSRTAC
jgi:hypothetical protein